MNKKINSHRWRSAVLAICACVTSPFGYGADAFVSKPVMIYVPFSAGSATDVIARAYAVELAKVLRGRVVVDNKPGAGQAVAASLVARAPADGHTLLFANIPAVVPPSIQKQLPYRNLSDFSAIADVLKINMMLVVRAGMPVSNFKEFSVLLKKNPSDFSYGSAGIASPIHLMAEMFNKELGVSVLHVPYRGGAQVHQELVSDRISYAFAPMGAMEFVKAGRIRSLGIAADRRDPEYPEVPTLEEAGLPNFRAAIKFAVLGPKNMPATVVENLNSASNKVIANSEFFEKVKSVGGVEMAAPASSSEVARRIANEELRWDALVKSANIKLE